MTIKTVIANILLHQKHILTSNFIIVRLEAEIFKILKKKLIQILLTAVKYRLLTMITFNDWWPRYDLYMKITLSEELF